tara:strand:+ start:476 stop:877 length:402 start_codon:yes stop_codon:yes gene_type:complete
MLVGEILKEAEDSVAPRLVQVLRTLIAQADSKREKLFLHFTKPLPNDIRNDARNLDLNKLMQNVGAEQFDYETFKAAYDTDARVKTMVANFSEKGIEPKTKEQPTDSPVASGEADPNAVSNMAKSATDLGDKL